MFSIYCWHWVTAHSMCIPCHVSFTKLVNVMFCKWVNWFLCKFAQGVCGVRAWSDQLWGRDVASQSHCHTMPKYVAKKSLLARYLKIYMSNFNQTWQGIGIECLGATLGYIAFICCCCSKRDKSGKFPATNQGPLKIHNWQVFFWYQLTAVGLEKGW